MLARALISVTRFQDKISIANYKRFNVGSSVPPLKTSNKTAHSRILRSTNLVIDGNEASLEAFATCMLRSAFTNIGELLAVLSEGPLRCQFRVNVASAKSEADVGRQSTSLCTASMLAV